MSFDGLSSVGQYLALSWVESQILAIRLSCCGFNWAVSRSFAIKGFLNESTSSLYILYPLPENIHFSHLDIDFSADSPIAP